LPVVASGSNWSANGVRMSGAFTNTSPVVASAELAQRIRLLAVVVEP
jgi:hypothetical protein